MNKHTPGPWNRIKGDRNVYSASGTVCKTPAIIGGGSAATNWEANARLIAAAPDLLEALESVSQEHDLLRWMKNIEMRRSQGSFGIAVADDSDAIGWQEQAEKLKVLVDRRESAIARARGEA